jgi:hypothetical protein
MYGIRLSRKRWAAVGLAAGVWAAGASRAPAQDAAPPAVAPAPVVSTPAPATPALPDPSPGDPVAVPAGDACGASCESVWSKVPPVTPTPRLGWFLIPPSGPGYYSLRDLHGGDCRKEAPNFPYPPTSFMAGSFFDADFRYLDKAANTQFDFFDAIKRVRVGDHWLFTAGGEERVRYVNEVNSGTRLTGADNVYELLRSRVYGDLWYRDVFRVYAEFIDARTYNQDLPPLPIDQNKADIQNLFIDLKVGEVDCTPVYVRAGRQELLYGSERLISPLDWANTRRTFEGVKGFWHSDQWDVDAFWVKPVVPSPSHFDSWDDKQNFEGVWATYKPRQGTTWDLYYLNLDNRGSVATGRDGATGGLNVSTLGSRYAGDSDGRWLYDAEGMFQFGTYSNEKLIAGAYTLGGGYRFKCLPMTPEIWGYYDYASGDNNPGMGDARGTFQQLFPFGHYYFGAIDSVGRQNIEDFSLQLSAYPAKWVTTTVQFHTFRLAEEKDALYNAAGKALRQDLTGKAGTDVGQEIDCYTNFHLTTHQDVWVGYSKLFAGGFIKRTGSPDSPELFYLQYSYKY